MVDSTCYFGCRGQGRPLYAHDFLHRELNESSEWTVEASGGWDSLTWHILSCRSWPWATSEVSCHSTLPQCSNLDWICRLLHWVLCFLFQNFFSYFSHFLLLEYPPHPTPGPNPNLLGKSSCDSFLAGNAFKYSPQSEQYCGLSPPAWRAGWTMGPWCELLRIYYCYWSREVIQVSICLHSFTDLH